MVMGILLWGITLAQAAQNQDVSGFNSSVLVAIVTAIATFGGAFLMFRGKTQDTANWLIVELRNEAKAAREFASECDDARQDQAEQIEVLEAQVRSLTRRLASTEEKVAKYQDCDKIDP